MKIKEIISDIESARPGVGMSISEYTAHLNRLEKNIYSNIISTHMGASEFAPHDSIEDTLLLPDNHAEIYKYYILAQIDLQNGDITRYTNNMLLYNNLIAAYTDWYNRNHMPKQGKGLRWY